MSTRKQPIFFAIAFTAGWSFGLTSCAAPGSTPDPDNTQDPAGTVTTDLRAGAAIRFLTGSTNVDLDGDDLNLDTSLNFQGTIAGVGLVSGVGEITTIPSSGFVQSFAAEPGTGLVVKTSDGLGLFYAVFIDADIVSTTGGILGKTIKWHSLTTFETIAVTPANATIIRPAPGVSGCEFSPPLPFTATGTNSDGSTNDVTTVVGWSSSPTPDGGNVGPFLSPAGIATASGSSMQANACPPTPLSTYTISATYSLTATTGSTQLTVQ